MMNIFAIGDLHFSFKNRIVPGEWEKVDEYKTMNIFGSEWEEHYRKIYKHWHNKIKNDDLVLIPGDISWASDLNELKPDIDFIESLPGKKVFVKGNHDYWWQGISKVREAMPEDFYMIQNDSYRFKDLSIAGSRGWIPPNSFQFSEHDEKIYKRELIRLKLSLKTIKNSNTRLVMLHYMPVNENHNKNEFIELMLKYKVDICIYGHLHGKKAHQNRISGEKWGIDFKLVSADFLKFNPELIFSI